MPSQSAAFQVCNYLLSLVLSHFWFAMPQLVLQADWQEVWHSPQPPFLALSHRLRVSMVLMCSINSPSNIKSLLIIVYHNAFYVSILSRKITHNIRFSRSTDAHHAANIFYFTCPKPRAAARHNLRKYPEMPFQSPRCTTGPPPIRRARYSPLAGSVFAAGPRHTSPLHCAY